MKVGRGTEDGVAGRPADRRRQRGKVAELVEDAIGRGAKAVVGGHARDGAGYFYEPTVLTDVPDDAKLLHEEIFGPVAPVKGFADEDEAIAAANDTEYGLVAYVFTNNLKRALRVVERLETGMVGLNQGMVSNAGAPFGGDQAVGLRPRGRLRGHRGVPRDEVRRDQPLSSTSAEYHRGRGKNRMPFPGGAPHGGRERRHDRFDAGRAAKRRPSSEREHRHDAHARGGRRGGRAARGGRHARAAERGGARPGAAVSILAGVGASLSAALNAPKGLMIEMIT